MIKQRTPYDTGKRSEPKVWGRKHIEDDDDYGKVDFEDDAGGTLATLYIEKGEDGGYTLTGDANEALKVDIDFNTDEEPLIIQPTAVLQQKVRDAIAELPTAIERESADVFWEWKTALILVPGERHVRKQQLIMVYDTELHPSSAKVGNWASGVRDTEIR